MHNCLVKALSLSLLLSAALLLAGCEQRPDSGGLVLSGTKEGLAAGTLPGPAPASTSAKLSDAEVSHFDALTSPAVIFPDSVDFKRYIAHPPLTEAGRRSYVFELRAEPTMTPGKHFQVVTVTWARAGAFTTGAGNPRLRSTGGPDGGIVDASVRTADQAYDVNISLATLLPDTVDSTGIDLEKAVLALARRHETASLKR